MSTPPFTKPATSAVNQYDRMRRIQKIHFIGIGGAGMCGIAEVLFNQGYVISGSDIKSSHVTKRLQSLGIDIFIGHDKQNISGADVIVVSSAIDPKNPEILQALAQKLPVVRRADMLGELMRYRHSIAVAGAHGKTTTTSMLTTMLSLAGLDPTYVIGGKLNATGKNAQLGSSRYLVAEADESDASFLSLRPMAAIVTNIDADHMDTYEGSFEKLKQAYIQFLHNMPFYGVAVLCGDDDELMGMIGDIARPVITFGLGEHNDVCAKNITQDGTTMRFSVHRKDKAALDVTLNIPGVHNVYNALAAIALASDEGVSDEVIVSALDKFSGVGRRFEHHGAFIYPKQMVNDAQNITEDAQNNTLNDVLLVDDYGHHPAEVQATIIAAKNAYPDRRLVMMFQPHRYSRTRDCFDEFVSVLSQVDELFLLEVYSAGEAPIAQADSCALARSLRHLGKEVVLLQQNDIASLLPKILRAGDLLITQGAGNVGQICTNLAAHHLYLS